ncbi:hypothetical protein AAZX31_08G303000 [Glycine max]|nr:hypothetical protein GLYMA_08G314201v4 [Glycine max]KAH1054037.1 hypothetical protein GYH30_023016 [Glycine max]
MRNPHRWKWNAFTLSCIAEMPIPKQHDNLRAINHRLINTMIKCNQHPEPLVDIC